MEQKEFEKHYSHLLGENFQKHVKYINYELKVFFELRAPIYQQVSCLILELSYPSITLTNFILERLLKLALIYKVAGIRPIAAENINTVFKEADEKYGSLQLGNSIEQCKKEGLITETEKNTLFNKIREMMRNGFSHADAGKIMVNVPDRQTVIQVNIANPDDIQELELNPKVNPTMQYIFTEMFAKANYLQYFNYVFDLIHKIEERLIEMDRQ